MVDLASFPALALGYSGSLLSVMGDQEVVGACGNGIMSMNLETKENEMFRGKGLSVGPVAVNRKRGVVAYAERTSAGRSPCIFLMLWDSKKLHSKLEGLQDQLAFTSLDFSLDGTLLVSLGDVPDFSLVIWDWERSDPLVSSVCSVPCSHVRFNPSTPELLVSMGDGAALIWRFDRVHQQSYLSNEEVKFPGVMEHQCLCVTWMPGDVVVMGLSSGELMMIDGNTTQQLTTEEGDLLSPLQVCSCAITALDVTLKHIVCGCADGVVRWVASSNYTVSFSTNPIPGAVMAVTFSPAYNIMIVGSSLSKIYSAVTSHGLLTSGESGWSGALEMRAVAELHTDAVTAVDQVVGALVCTTSSDNTVILWDTRNYRVVSTISLSPQDKAAGTTQPSSLPTLNLGSPGALMTPKPGSSWSPGIQHGGWHDLDTPDTPAKPVQKPAVAQKPPATTGPKPPAPPGPSPPTGPQWTSKLLCIAASQLARLVAVGDSEGRVTLIDFASLAKPRIVFRDRLHKGPVVRMRWHPHHNLLLTVSRDATACFLAATEETVKPLGWKPLPAAALDCRWGVMGQPIEGEDGDFNITHAIISTTDGGLHMLTSPPITHEPQGVYLLGDEICFLKSLQLQSPALHFVLGLANADGTAMVVFAYVGCKKIRWYQIDDILFRNEDIALVTSSEESVCVGSGLALSDDGALLASCDLSGAVSVYPANNLAVRVTVHAHDLCLGGASGAMFTEDGGTLVSIGHDGVVLAHGLQPEGPLNVDAPSLVHVEESSVALVRDFTGELEPPPSDVIFDRLVSGQESKAVASAIFTPGVGAVDRLRGELKELRTRFLTMLDGNKEAPDLEKLDENEFVVDLEMRDKLLKDAESQVREVEEQVKLENLGKELITQRLYTECVESVDVMSIQVQPLSQLGGQSVPNYPIRKPDALEGISLETTTVFRKMELEESKNIKNAVLSANIVMTESQQAKHAARIAARQQRQAEADGEAQPTPDLPDFTEVKGDDPNPKYLLYPAFELTMGERKVGQAHRLRHKVRDVQRAFNAEVKAILIGKAEELHKIQEKAARLEEIDEELRVAPGAREPLYLPKNAESETPGLLLKVSDDEVKAERVIPEEELAAIEARRLQEIERARTADVEGIKRAIDHMMGGSLEVPKKNELEALEKPEFLDEPQGDVPYTEEQLKQIKEYEKRLKSFLEDKEKQRKVLEAEAKKLRREIEETCEAFDERLRGLWEKRLQHDAQVNALELQMLLMAEDVNTEADLTTQILHAADAVDALQDKVEVAHVEYTEMKQRVDVFRDEYESVLVEDKQLEKQFRREFADNVEVYEALFKLFKKRRYPNREEDGIEKNGLGTVDPWEGARKPSDEDQVPVPDPLDPEEDAIEGLEHEVWDRLVEVRDEKVQAELDIKHRASMLGELNRRLQQLADREAHAQEQYENAVAHLDELRRRHHDIRNDLRLLVQVKQGQLEVNETGSFTMDDLLDALSVDREVLEARNQTIQQLGREKVQVMQETKDFKRKIHMLRWDNEVLDARSKGVQEDTRYYQLLRVTKSLQEMIKGGVKDKNAAEVATLEKQLEHAKDLHDIRVDEMKRKLFKIHRSIREKEVENEKLEEYVQDLAVSVAQRDKIMQVRASEAETGEEREYRMQELVWRRLVLEEARQQSEDIDILKSEVDRLRQRTFPSFAKSYQAASQR
eukprot:CAMPEP_0114562008 /NCGR_PEP_ID=MMETSP0114-20121206/12300_1 /TAXON_ID=31324 /ORGANISM="Goniomonas sp, Strain m" /LENGTH=1687 /DNA_ID=CAMNT_0001747665 /DNA_START=89 /DNA_END=5153 /DNA_ORIENTATION=+